MWVLLALLSVQALLDEGVRLFETGQLTAAAGKFETAVEQEPRNALAWKLLGTAYAAQGDHEGAQDPLRRACALQPKLADACFYHARNLYLVNRFEESRRVFERLLGGDPQRWRVENGLGLALEALGETREAERLYRKAAQSAMGNPNEHPLINLGVLLGREGRTAEAEAVLLEAVKKAPGSTRAWFELGRTVQELGRNEEAVKALERSVQIDGRNWAAHALLGKVYLRLGREEDGRRHLQIGQQGLTGR